MPTIQQDKKTVADALKRHRSYIQQDKKTVAAALKRHRSHTRSLRYGGLAADYDQAIAACEAFARIIHLLNAHTAREQNQTEE